MEVSMRARYVIAVVVVLILAFGAKQFLFPPKQAEADVHAGVGLNVFQMQHETSMKTLAAPNMHDMTFVFDAD
jgi:hypothetical protein